MIIDGDGHLVEPLEVWTDYVDPAHRDRVQVTYDAEGWMERITIGDFVLRDTPRHGTGWGMGDALTPGGLKPGRIRQRHFEEAEPGGWDPDRRLQVHDEEGIVAAVLFPSLGMYLPSITDPLDAEVAARAINDWAATAYAARAPQELYVVASLPGFFPERAAAELRRTVEEYGFVAGTIRPNPTLDGRTLGHPSFDVLWQTAEELGVPICVHGSNRDYGLDQLGKDRVETWMMRHAAVHPLEAMMAFAAMYEGGVFERHPDLRIGYMEAACGWVPFWIERLEEHLEVLGHLVEQQHRRGPREVFVAQCVVGCEGDEEMAPYVQERFGNDKVLWASDFPHFDTEPPFSQAMRDRDDMSPEQKRACMLEAAAGFYRLDLDAIRTANQQRRGATVAST